MPKTNSKSKKLAYAGLIFVIFIWGASPLVTLHFYKYYSPTIRITFSSLVCAIALLIISGKKLSLLNRDYFKVAIPTGFFMAVADVLQKIGLQYTTPTHYSFLENLSVLVVPILLIFFTKKKPGFLTILGSVLCLVSCFILSGISSDTSGASLAGDLLCALAGIFYGVNIAATGVYAKKLYAPLYLTVQMFTEFAVSSIAAIILNLTDIEKIKFSFDIKILLANAAVVFIISTLCWLIRTNAMKQVNATVVAVMMPFSSVITTILSIIAGKDALSKTLVVGVVLGLAAIIISSLGDREKKKQVK
jgi:drug/metabolite transporter (DMT)-like permease